MQLQFSILLALLPLATSDPQQGRPASEPAQGEALPPLPAMLPPTFPREGVDHVVTYASWRGWGPKGGDRVVRIRRGHLVRIDTTYIGSRRDFEPARTSSFSNLTTGASMAVTPGADGALEAISIWKRRGPDIPIFRHRLVRTGASERIAGERCRVWEAKPESKDGVTYSTCVTSDGIALRNTVHFTDGRVMEEQHALTVERRQVPIGEVLPPTDALDWQKWSQLQPESPETASGRPNNYSLTLVRGPRRDETEAVTKTFSADGGWEMEEDRTASAPQLIQIAGPAVMFSYFNKDTQLSIGRKSGRAPLRLGGGLESFGSAPLPKAGTTVLGQPCTWFDAAKGVSDYGREECRTGDSLPLIIDEFSGWGGGTTHWLVTSISRGQTPTGSVRAPDWLMNWSFWGWPELDPQVQH